MTHDPQDPTSLPANHPPRPPDDGASDWVRVPPPLRNWQVVEIEGEATLIDEPDEPAVDDETDAGTPARAPIPDRGDDVIVLGLSPRRVELAAGESAELAVELLNNGQWAAQFDLTLEGWVSETWFQADDAAAWPARVSLQPGERCTLRCTLTLPLQPLPSAGDYPFAVTAQAARYPGRRARAAATANVAAVQAFDVGTLRPDRIAVGWWRRRAAAVLPVSNHGNVATTLTVLGLDREHSLDYAFARSDDVDARAWAADGELGWETAAHGIRLTLEPGETQRVALTVEPRRRPLLALTPWQMPFRVVARADGDATTRRAAEGRLAVHPLIGPWHLMAGALAGAAAFFALGLSGLALLLALRNAALPSAPVIPAAAEAPAVALIIHLDQPAPARAPETSPSIAAPPVQAIERAPVAPPVVRADQITAPGEPTPEGQPPLLPVIAPADVTGPGITAPGELPPRAPAAPRPDTETMTYAQMFQDIGLRYDLDWRMLAAVAYVESGFDSLALSGQGDMGLMQIRTATWREWAPTVDASDPFDSYSNVLVAARYLDYLRTLLGSRGHPQPEWMLIAYNWGPEPVLTHLAAGGTLATLNAERRAYAEDVLRIVQSIPLQ